MLPTAPPTFCNATTILTGKFESKADSNCNAENKILETVLDPEIKAPNIPIKGATTR